LEDTGVAMLPGVDFGRPPEELSARIAYVDFDGSKAMEASLTLIENHKDIHDQFIEMHCPKLVKSVELLGNWLLDL
jgi:aspartate aminotransferase